MFYKYAIFTHTTIAMMCTTRNLYTTEKSQLSDIDSMAAVYWKQKKKLKIETFRTSLVGMYCE